MPLLLTKVGDKLHVFKISGSESMRSRIQSMGILEGSEIEILSFFAGNIVILIKGTKLALSKEIASKIQVM